MRRRTKKKKSGGFKNWFRNLKTWQKVMMVVLLIILITAVAAFAYMYVKLGKLNRDKLDKRDLSCVDVDGYANILLLGVDSRDMKDLKGSRTDAIMIASIKEETGEVYITSIYRDTYLKMGNEDLYDKVTHAFAYGGVKESIKTINQALDLNIDKYVLFNFKAVADVVDGVGGITVDIHDYEIPQLNKYTIETANNIGVKDYHLVEEPGEQTIEGVQAVSYGRIRKGVGDDLKRTERMRIVATKILGKIKKMPVTKIDKLIDKVLPQIKTNLSNSDILALAFNASKYKIVGSSGFPYTISAGLMNGVSYVFPEDLEKDVIKMHEDVFHQKDYKPSRKCIEISDQIKNDIGAAGGTQSLDIDKFTDDPENAGDAIEPTPKTDIPDSTSESGTSENTAPSQPETKPQPPSQLDTGTDQSKPDKPAEPETPPSDKPDQGSSGGGGAAGQ